MKYNELGINALKVSALSMGTLHLNKSQLSFFDAAFDLGVNHFDTADSYNDGASDQLLAQFLKGKQREKVILSSKVFYPTIFGNTKSGLNKNHVLESVDLSLKRLNTDFLDILYLHRFDAETPFSETLEAVNILLTEGKIRHWGISAFSTFQLTIAFYEAKKCNVAAPIVGQYAYNLFNRSIELELKEALTALDINIVAYYGIAQGVLSGKYQVGSLPTNGRARQKEAVKGMWDFTPNKLAQAKSFAAFCEDRNQNAAATALAWCLQNKNVASVLTHVSSLDQLNQNIQALQISFSENDLQLLQSIFNNKPVNLYTNVAY